MAASTPPPTHITASRPKQRRATLKKERRKRRRQALAKIRDAELHEEEETQQKAEEESEEERKADEEKQRLHQEWLERERVAQEEFRLKKEKEETARRKKEEEEKKIQEEWGAQQRKEQEEQERKQREKRERETYSDIPAQSCCPEENEAVQKMLDAAESQLENGGAWKNPEAPVDYGTEKDRANCPFFLKTGACRFGDRCSRKHLRPTVSSTLMIRGMFVTFGMEQSRRDDYDTDSSLEYSEEEMFQQFLEFYDDVLPEFKSLGKVVQFKVSCNYEPHLRGNVYVQYDSEEQCHQALVKFNGRWYAGKQLQCEFCPVTRWRPTICRLYDRQKCPKGKHCNFLHVFRNPRNEFWEADRDLNVSPVRGGTSARHSERLTEHRNRPARQQSRSPERSQHRRRERRSHSRERSRFQQSWRSRYPNRDRRSRSRSWSKNRSSNYNGEEEERKGSNGSLKERHYRRSRSPRRDRSRTSGHKEHSAKRRKRSRSSNSKTREVSGKPSGDSPESHHRKHSKKDKKKSKKKKKHKKNKPAGESSSADSEAEPGNNEVADTHTEQRGEEQRSPEELLEGESTSQMQEQEHTEAHPDAL